MKIASGVAEGLEYLHEKGNSPIIYRDLKSSNILLDEEFNPRLSQYGLAKLVQCGNKMHVTPRVMAAYGYSAPEYERKGELSLKSDVYSFGVVLLELITGRRAFDNSRPIDEQNLVTWVCKLNHKLLFHISHRTLPNHTQCICLTDSAYVYSNRHNLFVEIRRDFQKWQIHVSVGNFQ